MKINTNSEKYTLECCHLMSNNEVEVFQFKDSTLRRIETVIIELAKLRHSFIYSQLKTIDLINMREMVNKELITRGIEV